jgi:transposase-like protein
MRKVPRITRYSEAFKLKVVSEIESGKFSIHEAKKIYQITGGQTVRDWMKKYGKGHLVSKIIRVEMKNEKDRLKQLEAENRQLKELLATKDLHNLLLEKLIESADEYYNTDLKKNFGDPRSKRPGK